MKNCFIIIVASFILGCGQQGHAPQSTRLTNQGEVVGKEDKYNTFAWLGVPYAQPPMSSNRWQKPLSPKAHSELLYATKFKGICPQIGDRLSGVNRLRWGKVVGTEDCLHLNIWAPRNTQLDSKLPVMVWVHGGGNVKGTGNIFHGYRLAGEHRVIVITLNYRLGVLGWFKPTDLEQPVKDDVNLSGNFGLLDIIESLDWINNNISSFGGDPNNITLFGESAGARNINTLMFSKLAKPLFHKAIVQSGSLKTVPYTSHQGASALECLKRNTLKKKVLTTEIVHDARGLDLHDLFKCWEPPALGMYAYRDGSVIPERPLPEVVLSGENRHNIQTMIGTNKDEHKVYLYDDKRWTRKKFGFLPRAKTDEEYERVSRYYTDAWKALGVEEQLKSVIKKTTDTYVYRFDWDGQGSNWIINASKMLGASHGVEVNFVFGDFDHGIPFPFTNTSKNKSEREHVSLVMRNLWAEFARSGDPNRSEIAPQNKWVPRKKGDHNTFILDYPTSAMAQTFVDADSLKTRLLEDEQLNSKDRCSIYKEVFVESLHTNYYSSKSDLMRFCGE